MRKVTDLNIIVQHPAARAGTDAPRNPPLRQPGGVRRRIAAANPRNPPARRSAGLLLVVGPCSIHDPRAGLEYATRLRRLIDRVNERLLLVMRCYFEKSRTSVGWKGLIMDPHLDGSDDIPEGLRIARRILRDIIEMGVPTATELLDPITPQYIADLICWSAVGARTTESQTHRQMASGAFDAAGVQERDARFSGAGRQRDQGRAAAADVSWASAATAWPRPSPREATPTATSFFAAATAGRTTRPSTWPTRSGSWTEAGLEKSIVVDCSHGNSGKDPARQPEILCDVIAQRAGGTAVDRRRDAGEQPGRRQPAVSGAAGKARIRPVDYRRLHRLEDDGADRAGGGGSRLSPSQDARRAPQPQADQHGLVNAVVPVHVGLGAHRLGVEDLGVVAQLLDVAVADDAEVFVGLRDGDAGEGDLLLGRLEFQPVLADFQGDLRLGVAPQPHRCFRSLRKRGRLMARAARIEEVPFGSQGDAGEAVGLEVLVVLVDIAAAKHDLRRVFGSRPPRLARGGPPRGRRVRGFPDDAARPCGPDRRRAPGRRRPAARRCVPAPTCPAPAPRLNAALVISSELAARSSCCRASASATWTASTSFREALST